MEILFWLSSILLFFVYVLYGPFVWAINQLLGKNKKIFTTESELPEIAFLIASYNEEEVIEEKILNTLNFNYPKEKLNIYVIADGSDDQTNAIVKKYGQVKLLWQPTRKGKTAAINRAMPLIKEPIVVFSDANVMVNSEAILAMVKHYSDENVGGVSGEKRVLTDGHQTASATEGIYWKYESFLKREDAKLKTLVGAAGELFSIRTNLFVPLQEDTLLDDFIISMNIIKQGYTIAYEPNAFASEMPSLDIAQEFKRKVRIGAGGMQSVLRLGIFLNPFTQPVILFQYIFHRFSRWILSPILLLVAFVSNVFLIYNNPIYTAIFIAQLLFHTSALLGWILERKEIKFKLFYIPFYFNFMHVCIVLGWIKFLSGKQKVTWQKATRLAYN